MKIELVNEIDYKTKLRASIELDEIAFYSESLSDTFNGLKESTKIILKSGEKIVMSRACYEVIRLAFEKIN